MVGQEIAHSRAIVSVGLKKAYDEQYTDDMTGWREVGAKYKTANLLKVCEGRQFNLVLDCGAGEGSILQRLSDEGTPWDLYAIEISESGLERIRNRPIPKLNGTRLFDGYKIPYPDDSFDLAYCSHVIEHVEHPRLLLRELKRVSRFQAFEVPLDYSMDIDERTDHYLEYGHINAYTPALFRFLLKTEGFEILKDLRSTMPVEVLKYNAYVNQARAKTWRSELKFGLEPLKHLARRIKHGRRRFQEVGYASYTCLATA